MRKIPRWKITSRYFTLLRQCFFLSLQGTVKKHEGRLAALKKGNYLLKAQVDRLKDDLVKQREESISLQEDLDSVLAELG